VSPGGIGYNPELSMRFQILSHAGLRVQARGIELVIDPWLLGSCYWRSWWNYPPVSPDLIAGLRPDFIYLTHIHWDHFHGVSLRRFPLTTPILVPKGHHDRMKRDLVGLGFRDVRELRHGEGVSVGDGFRLTSYQFLPSLDSAVVVEADGVTLLDANDAKFMGAPLTALLRRHPPIDFVFRSHSSANARLCYEIVDAPDTSLDDEMEYVTSFLAFARRTGARYAIPFASNHCFLHADTFDLNDTVTTPLAVEERARLEPPGGPEVKLMVSGDSWSADGGFSIAPDNRDWFTDRDSRLRAYRDAQQEKLEAFYRKEAAARVSTAQVEKYFATFARAIPAPLRRLYRGIPLTYVLTAGERRSFFEVDLWTGRVTPREDVDPKNPVFEVHTSAFIFKQAMGLDLFAHVPISKRVRYRVEQRTLRRMQLLNYLFILYESDWLPLAEVMWPRFLETWGLRWRELALYGRIVADVATRRRFDQERYIGRTPIRREVSRGGGAAGR
jgi:UDP-MurNAc hydroxylase